MWIALINKEDTFSKVNYSQFNKHYKKNNKITKGKYLSFINPDNICRAAWSIIKKETSLLKT